MSKVAIGSEGPEPRRRPAQSEEPEAVEKARSQPRRRRKRDWRVVGERGHLIIERHFHHVPWNVATACDLLITPSAKDSVTDINQVQRCPACVMIERDWTAKEKGTAGGRA